MSKKTVIIIRESFGESVAKDAVTFAALLGVVGVGIWLNSQALQWVGAIIWVLAVSSKAANHDRTMSVDEARARLDEIEADRRTTSP